MAEITLKISDDKFNKLKEKAQIQGISIEELLPNIIDDYLNFAKSDFARVASYVIKKNAELYRRLK